MFEKPHFEIPPEEPKTPEQKELEEKAKELADEIMFKKVPADEVVGKIANNKELLDALEKEITKREEKVSQLKKEFGVGSEGPEK